MNANIKNSAKYQCDMILTQLLGKDNIDGWWNSYNKSFNSKPIEWWENDWQRVYNYIRGQINSDYS